jgi:two-component system nitrate/nitrite response regulator NarL
MNRRQFLGGLVAGLLAATTGGLRRRKQLSSPSELFNRLSPREREVLALLGRGWSNAQIGRELYISPHTVRTHVQNILQKLEMHSRLEAALSAVRRGT